MNPDLFNQFGLSFWLIAKWFYVALYLIYFGFSLIVARQMQLMHKTLAGTGELSLKIVGVGLVIVSALALVLALVIL